MKFDHEYIEKNEILNKYLLHQLSKEETDKFEEHLLFCLKCREDVQKSNKIFDNIYSGSTEMNSEEKVLKVSDKKFNFRLFYRIAASLIILISVGAYLYFFSNKKQNQIKKQFSEISIIDTATTNEVDTIETNYNEPIHDELMASVEYDSTLFIESLFFERIIKDDERGSEVQIKLPQPGQEFTNNSEIVFKWEGDMGETFIVIFDNNEQLIFEQKASSPYIFTEKLMPGLYYWQLENDEYSLYTGKFIVK